MNKIIQININGLVFSIDEHAFDGLKQYLDRLHNHFSKVEGGHEIITDIEARIAELLQSRLSTYKQVVSDTDIKEVVAIMGDPLQMATDEEPQQKKEQSQTEEPRMNYGNSEKRLYRDEDNRLVGGVCSGVGAYFDIDPVWIRLAFAFAIFALGTGFLLYLILWIVIPKASTTAEKLQMRGKPVDITNIEKKIKDELKSVEEKLNAFAKNSKPKAKDGFRHLIEIVIKVVAMFAIAITRFVGFCLAVVSILMFVALMGLLLGLSWPVSFSPLMFLQILFAGTDMLYIGISGLLLFSIVPIVFLVYTGIKLLFNLKFKNKYFNRVAASFFGAGIILVLMSVAYLVKEFSVEAKIKTSIPLLAVGADTLYVDVRELSSSSGKEDRIAFNNAHLILFDDDTFLMEDVDLTIEQSDKPIFQLVRTVNARGRSIREANLAANQANPIIEQNDSTLLFESGFKLSKNNIWRNQRVSYKLKVPVGKTVIFMNGAAHLTINNGEVISNTTWSMTGNGFTCVNCEDYGSDEKQMAGTFQKKIPFELFTQVDINGRFEVVISQSNECKVTVYSAMKDDLNDVLIKRNGNTLQVEMEKELLNIIGLKGRKIQVMIQMPELEKLRASGLNEIYLSGINSKKFGVDISGMCNVKATSIKATNLMVDLRGASTLRIDGVCKELTADVSGTAELQAFDLESKNVTVDCSGAASAEVNALSSLTADASGTSEVRYKGKPSVKYVNQSGVAKVHTED
jgi:phage shock protein PspC (stress-responsive transcriptional regulator)